MEATSSIINNFDGELSDSTLSRSVRCRVYNHDCIGIGPVLELLPTKLTTMIDPVGLNLDVSAIEETMEEFDED